MTSDPSAAATPRVLVVDDEPNIRTAVVRALALSQYHVDEAGDGLAALRQLGRARYDVMLLDIRMPEMDGIEVMRRARRLQPDLLIIVLTGHAMLDSAIAAVKSGAVDYLMKPASLHDITAAVANALQSRAQQVQRQHLVEVMSEAITALNHMPMPVLASDANQWPDRFMQCGSLTLDRRKRLAMRGGDPSLTVELTEGETAILASLMQHADEVLTCRQLARLAWDYELDELEAQSLVRPYIFRLRQKLAASAAMPQLIQTVRGRGYLLKV